MERLKKVSISRLAAELRDPFTILPVARVGDVILSIYLCAGQFKWHKHIDYDELFWVYDGAMTLESEMGSVLLRPGELAVVPKGIEHRSLCEARAVVLLIYSGVVPHRKNGRRRLYAATGKTGLVRLSLAQAARELTRAFEFRTVADFDGTVLQVARGEGSWVMEVPAPQDVLLYVLEGTASVQMSDTMHHLHPGESSVVREGMVYHFSMSKDSVLLRVTRKH